MNKNTSRAQTILKCSNCKAYTPHRFYGEGGYVITVHTLLPYGIAVTKFDLFVCSVCKKLQSVDGRVFSKRGLEVNGK